VLQEYLGCHAFLTTFSRSLKFDAMRIFPLHQLILNITGQSANVVDLSKGAAMDRAAAIGWIPSVDSYLDAALMLHVHCHEFSLATANFEKLETSLLGIVRFHAVWHMRVFNFALVAIQNAKKTIIRGRRWRRKAWRYFEMMRTWVEDCQAINLGHKLKLLEAEMRTLTRPYPKDDVLKAAYDEAIVRAIRLPTRCCSGRGFVL
jgi:hypothetical protein